MNANAIRRTMIFGVGVLLVWTGLQLAAQSTQSTRLSAAEQAALEVAKGWISGWDAKDPEKIASYMAEDILWAGGFPDDPFKGMWRGRDRFVQQDGFAVRSGVNFQMKEVLATGGSEGTAILYRRADEFSFGQPGGQPVWFTTAVFNWVKDGKILVWLDAPTFFPPVPKDQAPPLTQWAPDEQKALDLVKGWVAAWNAKDADKVASFMADDVQYSAYYPRNITQVGKAHFLQTERGNIARGVEMRIEKSLALAGNKGAAVLVRRVDRFSVGGRTREVPTAGFFWIANGKIHTWFDLPLEAPPTAADGTPVVR